MAAAQDEQELQANRHRMAAPQYQVGDEVWLSLANRGREALGPRQARVRVLEVVGPRAYRLEVPGNSHRVFHTDLLRPAGGERFASQRRDDWQPPPEEVDGALEWVVEEILQERQRSNRRRQVEVRWRGYEQTSWEPLENLVETEAWERFTTAREAREGGTV